MASVAAVAQALSTASRTAARMDGTADRWMPTAGAAEGPAAILDVPADRWTSAAGAGVRPVELGIVSSEERTLPAVSDRTAR